MVHYYCFIQSQGKLDRNSRVFKIKVGTSDRDVIKSSLIENFANDLGWYYRLWDAETENYLILADKDRQSKLGISAYSFDIIQLSVQELYRHLQDATLDYVRLKSNYLHNRFVTLSALSTDFYMENQPANKKSLRRTLLRKYLSSRNECELINATIGMTAVVVLFILGAILEGMERSLL